MKSSESSAKRRHPLFDPFDPDFRVNPYRIYERLRREAPIYQTPFGSVVLSRYSECMQMLLHSRTSRDERNSDNYQQLAKQGGLEHLAEFRERMRPFMLMDPPDHTRLRGLVNKAFTARVVEGLRPRIGRIVNELIDATEGRGLMNVIEDFAYPVAVKVICELLGVPSEDQEKFKTWALDPEPAVDPRLIPSEEEVGRRGRAVVAFDDYLQSLVRDRLCNSRNDLLSGLVVAENEGDKLTEQEMLWTCILLFVAGLETTVNLIGNGILALLQHPAQMKMLRHEPNLAGQTVEEVLRYDPPIQMTARVALEDIDIGGGLIPARMQTVLLLASANRDPDQFPRPDQFDITRTGNSHIAFGAGIHFCIGAPLARLEGRIALGTLVQRLPKLELGTNELEYKDNIVVRGLARLPVVF